MRMSILLLLLSGAALTASAAADISGTWEFTVQTSAGSGNPTFTFRQDGEKLTGTYKGLLGEQTVTGTVKGDEVNFWFEASAGDQRIKVEYAGTIVSPTSMKGTVKFGDVGDGTWTGTKKQV